MFSALPDFTPRESHSLWYASSRAPILGGFHDHLGSSRANDGANSTTHHNHNQPPCPRRGHGHGHVLERTALARLAAEEAFMQRRRIGVQNYGSTWLKPPGIPKTLHQMREEKREQEEHREAMRRERLAQELADAEAEAAGGGLMEDVGDDDDDERDEAMDDIQLDGARDLDEEIPDADDDFAIGGSSDSEDSEQDDGGDNDDLDSEEEDARVLQEALREERHIDLVAARMRMSDDAFREALVRGGGAPDADDLYGGDLEGEEDLDGHGLGLVMDERDFATTATARSSRLRRSPRGDVVGRRRRHSLAMDTNLDDDIPEAELGGYEHTDSDAALSSQDDEEEDGTAAGEEEDGRINYNGHVGFTPRSVTAALRAPTSPTLQARHRHQSRSSAGPRSSADLSAFLSHDESSFMNSSPVQTRRNMRGG